MDSMFRNIEQKKKYDAQKVLDDTQKHIDNIKKISSELEKRRANDGDNPEFIRAEKKVKAMMKKIARHEEIMNKFFSGLGNA